MKHFCNISTAAVAKLLNIKLEGRKLKIMKNDDTSHFVSAQIRLYLLLNFYANSNTGMTDLLSIVELAEKLSCNVKTVTRSLNCLTDAGLLKVVDTPESGYAIIQIVNIKDMYKRLGEDGKGYLTCSTEELEAIVKIKRTAPLRAVMIGLIEFTIRNFLSASKKIDVMILNMNTVQSAFPKSARPSDIRSALNCEGAFGTLFERTAPDLKKNISVRLKEEFNAKYIKQRIRAEAKRSIFDHISHVNSVLTNVNTGIHEDGIIHINDMTDMSSLGIDLWESVDPIHQEMMLPLLDIPSSVKNDCITIAQDFDTEIVVAAINTFYVNYLLSGNFKPDEKKSLGGLLRRIVQELFNAPSEAYITA